MGAVGNSSQADAGGNSLGVADSRLQVEAGEGHNMVLLVGMELELWRTAGEGTEVWEGTLEVDMLRYSGRSQHHDNMVVVAAELVEVGTGSEDKEGCNQDWEQEEGLQQRIGSAVEVWLGQRVHREEGAPLWGPCLELPPPLWRRWVEGTPGHQLL